MIIGIDARFYGPFGKGLGRYTQKLVKHLEKIDHKNQYVIFLRKENWDDYVPENPNFRKVLADCEWYTLQEQLQMPKIIKHKKVDMMHFPHFNIPVLYRGKFITTIHDLILLKYPTKKATTLDPIKYWIKYYAYKKVIHHAVKKAEKIITVSNFTKKELVDYFKIGEEKIAVTYEASDRALGASVSIPDRSWLVKRGITKPFVLYVGNAYPHKNLEALIDAFSQFSKQNSEAQLVMVGKKDYFYEQLIGKSQELGLIENKKIIFFGFATDQELGDLYKLARLYIFPSFIEGFGLPPLEAMSYGLPVLSSNTSCLPEILGEAAHYFDPKSVDDMARSIKLVFEDKPLQHDLRTRGYKRVSEFSWKRCARETLDVYNGIR